MTAKNDKDKVSASALNLAHHRYIDELISFELSVCVRGMLEQEIIEQSLKLFWN